MPIPIVGQPLQIVHIETTATGFCNCSTDPLGRTLLVLHQGVMMVCPLCQHTYLLLGFNANGTLNIQYRKVTTPPGN